MTRNGPAALAVPASIVVAVLWLLVACATGGSVTPSKAPPTAAATTSTANVTPSATGPASSGEATASHVASPLAPASEPQTPSAASGSPPGSIDPRLPPPGSLSAGGEQVEGLPGTYCWNAAGVGSCVDSPAFTDREPDLPELTAPTPAGQLAFTLAASFPFVSWSASYADDNGNVVPLGGVESSFDPDASKQSFVAITTAAFPPPPAGQSIVQVFVRFADGGDASYGWNVSVP